MTEIDVISQLSGPLGGLFALGMVAGGLMMHIAHLRIIGPYVTRAHQAEIQALKDRVATNEQHIRDLEKFRTDYMEILEAHSGPTLHPKGKRHE
jgi:hypothetical protein